MFKNLTCDTSIQNLTNVFIVRVFEDAFKFSSQTFSKLSLTKNVYEMFRLSTDKENMFHPKEPGPLCSVASAFKLCFTPAVPTILKPFIGSYYNIKVLKVLFFPFN